MDSGRREALCLLVGVLVNLDMLAPPSGWRYECISHYSIVSNDTLHDGIVTVLLQILQH